VAYELVDGGCVLYKCVLANFAETQFVFYELARQLSILHKNSIFHRDIKFANTMYKQHPVPKLILIDFNLADYYVQGMEYYDCGTLGFLAP
jgi:serine/threonine protein kinase